MTRHTAVFENSTKLYNYIKTQHITDYNIITINYIKNFYGCTIGYELVYYTDLKNTSLKKKKNGKWYAN